MDGLFPCHKGTRLKLKYRVTFKKFDKTKRSRDSVRNSKLSL